MIHAWINQNFFKKSYDLLFFSPLNAKMIFILSSSKQAVVFSLIINLTKLLFILLTLPKVWKEKLHNWKLSCWSIQIRNWRTSYSIQHYQTEIEIPIGPLCIKEDNFVWNNFSFMARSPNNQHHPVISTNSSHWWCCSKQLVTFSLWRLLFPLLCVVSVKSLCNKWETCSPSNSRQIDGLKSALAWCPLRSLTNTKRRKKVASLL